MPENEATFAITPGGVSDAKEWKCWHDSTDTEYNDSAVLNI